MPDLNKLDWQKLKVVLDEELRNRDLITFEDVSRLEQRGELTEAILTVFRPVIMALYREEKQ